MVVSMVSWCFCAPADFLLAAAGMGIDFNRNLYYDNNIEYKYEMRYLL